MSELHLNDDIRDETRDAWYRYLDLLNPFRPDLHRYCLGLTGNLWDAEDLVQETVIKGFATLGSVYRTIDNPRGYLVRIATNRWTDALRRRDLETRTEPPLPGNEASPPEQRSEVRDASAVLVQRLPPQERAAFLLKEVFDMSLEEISVMLNTSVGAVKAALHRGRERVRADDTEAAARPVPSRALVERFVERLEARDLPALLDLMLDGATVEVAGGLVEAGRTQFSAEGSWLWQSVHVHPDLPEDMRPNPWENELVEFEGEPMMLSFTNDPGVRSLVSVARFEEKEGRIARIRPYYFCPESIREVARRLGYEVYTGLYRFPAPIGARSPAAQAK